MRNAIIYYIVLLSRQMEYVQMKLSDIKARNDSVLGAINKIVGGTVNF